MTMRMILFAPAILIMPLATGLITAQTSLAESAVNECKAKPDSTAPSGSHWYYRVNRTDNRHCWYLGAEGGKVRSQAREGAAHASPRTVTAEPENLPAMTPTLPASIGPSQGTTVESASAAVAEDFAPPSSDLPKTSDSTTREPLIVSTSPKEDREQIRAQEAMLQPVVAEPERAGPADKVRESASWAAFLIGALALLLVGLIFKLACRHTQSSGRNQRQVDRRGARQQRRADLRHRVTRPPQVPLKSAPRTQSDDTAWQGPTSIDPVGARRLRKLMHELQRGAA